MISGSKSMLYCPYCERKVRPMDVRASMGSAAKMAWVFFTLVTGGFALIPLFIWLVFRPKKHKCICPICNASLRPSDLDG